MRPKPSAARSYCENLVKIIRRATRKNSSAEDKIPIILDGLRGKSSIAVLFRRESIPESLNHSLSSEFLEAEKQGTSRRSLPSKCSNCGCSRTA